MSKLKKNYNKSLHLQYLVSQWTEKKISITFPKVKWFSETITFLKKNEIQMYALTANKICLKLSLNIIKFLWPMFFFLLFLVFPIYSLGPSTRPIYLLFLLSPLWDIYIICVCVTLLSLSFFLQFCLCTIICNTKFLTSHIG